MPRAAHNLLPRIDAQEECELLVIGGGMAGICAAIAAARNGCQTTLLEMEELLGGNGGPLVGVHVSGAHSFHPYASETGIIEEIELEAARQAAKTRTHGSHYNASYQWDLVLQQKLEESGVQVLRRHQGRRAVTDGRRVTAVLVEDIQTYCTKLISVRHGILEASGDGTVAADAGATYMWGTEARDQFHERSAPEKALAATMGNSLTALVLHRQEPVDFVLPPQLAARAAAEGPPEKLRGYPSSWNPDAEFCFLWATESGGERNTIADAAAIRRELLYQLYRLWDNVKNHSFVERARNWELVWVSPRSGKRESRRFVGDYVLTQTDVEAGRTFDDAIGYGGYGVDVHEPQGTRSKVTFYSIPPLWNFPYRSAYSKDFDNLWLAGRLMSVSHLALGTVRLQRTLAAIGQGVGTAAALAKTLGCTARELYEKHRERLRETLLAQDATLLDTAHGDPRDLARGATVTASSQMRHGSPHVTGYLPLDVPRGVQLWDWAPTLESADFMLRNTTGQAQQVTLRLSLFAPETPWKESKANIAFRHLATSSNRMEWGSDNRLPGFRPVAESVASVPAWFEGWMRFAFPQPVTMIPKDPTSDESRYNLMLDACPGVELATDAHQYDFALRAWLPAKSPRYEVAADCHSFHLAPEPRYGEAANVIDGHHRRYATNPVHAWLSDADQPLPQSVTLTFPEPRDVARVQLALDTIDRAYRDAPINCDERYARRCATDYQIELETDAGWRPVVAEQGNYQRHRVHTFAAQRARALRLTILAVRDERFRARVYEIRVYET